MHLTNDRARTIADAIDAYEDEIATLQSGKRDTYADLRTELMAQGLSKDAVSVEIAALKSAIALRRKRRTDPEAIDEKEAATAEYLSAIDAPSRARVAHGAREAA